MPVAGVKMVARPEFDDATRLASYWMSKMLEEIQHKVNVVELKGADVTKNNLYAVLDGYDPFTCWMLGHGSEDIFTGHNREVLLKVGVNLGLMAGRVSHFVSCLFGVKGAPGIIDAGGVSVFAYTRDFIVGLEIEPYPESKITRSLMEPDCWVEVGLAEGKSCAEVLVVSQTKRDEWLEYWANSGDPYRDIIIWSIINNYTDAQILLGEGSVQEPVAPAIRIEAMIGLWLSIFGVGYQFIRGTEVKEV